MLILGCLTAGVRPSSTALRPRVPLEREIRIGEVHGYPVELAAGQFLDAFVEQGIDVKIELLNAEGKVVFWIDGPNGIRDVEELAFVADRPGLYVVRVSAASKDAPPGRYRIRLEPLRTAGEVDRLRMEAVLATHRVVLEMADGAAFASQLADREETLALWRKVGDPNREAEELYQIGVLQGEMDQLEQAADLHRRAAELWQAQKNRVKQVLALNELGRVLSNLNRSEEALQTLDAALSLAREVGDLETQAKALNNRGQLLNNLGEAPAARQDLEEALRLTLLQAGRCPASPLVNLGSTYESLGDPDQAISFYKEALKNPCNEEAQAAALNNLGYTHYGLGDWGASGAYYTQALALNRASQDRHSEATTLNNLALVHQKQGKREEARAAYEQALELARETENREALVSVLLNLGSLYLRMDRRDDAIRLWEQVPALAGSTQDMKLRSLQAQALVQREKGELGAARTTLESARQAARDQGAIAWEAELGIQLARIQKRQGDLEAAAQTAKDTLNLIESLRGQVISPDLRAVFLDSRQEYYELAIEILMALHARHPGQGFDARALQVSERARARSLLDLLTEAGANIRKGADPALIQLERDRRAAVRARDQRHLELIHQGADPEQIAEAQRKLQEALDDYKQVETDLRGRLYASLILPQPLSAAEIQQQILGERTLLLEYALGTEKSYLWAVTPTSLQSFELPGRKAIEEPAGSFYRAVTVRNTQSKPADQQAETAALSLSRLILAQVEPLLGDRVLLVVGDGVLQYIPFAALPLPSSPGKRVRNDIVVLPSASMLAVQRRELAGRREPPKTLAIFADPLFLGHPDLPRLRAEAGKNANAAPHRGIPGRGGPGSQGDTALFDPRSLPSLPFSKVEADKIARLVPLSLQWKALGAEASVANVLSGPLKDFRYVHFATHGYVNTEHPELSSLALSQFDAQGKPLEEDGLLRLQEIYNLDLDADLVVLSACDTALGKEIRGEGLVGLTRGFLYAGSSRVLASLWRVPDQATSLLMQSFYRHLLEEKRSPAAALRHAQTEMAARYPSPYFWAGFSLQGEWR